jgi:fructose-1,6-bisphosphatase II
MQARLQFRNDEERQLAKAMGVKEPDKVMTADDMAGGNVMFAATGVTNGDFLKGVRFTGEGARSNSVVMRSKTGTMRLIETVHRFSRSPNYGW